jgi:hypothetical protein
MASAIRKKIIGTWKLVSWTYKNEKGEVVHYFGKTVSGILMYDKNGYMNAQLMRALRPEFNSEAIAGATSQEAHEAFNSYIAYFGKYYEPKPGEIVHDVEGSLFPNWTGNKQVRYGKVIGDTLILRTPLIPVKGTDIAFSVKWKRVSGKKK